MNRTSLQIAIDGPVAAGKSTVAQLVAERLKFTYIDTGAMYRAVALAAQRKGIDWGDEKAVCALVQTLHIRLTRPVGKRRDGRKVTVYLGNEDVSWEIRSQELGEGASVVSQYPAVRTELVRQQQQLAQQGGVVMEGRDIGTRVLPDAQLKIYMDADVEERVARKQGQLASVGQTLTTREVKQALMKRDNREMTRAVDPLRAARDAWVFNTTGLTVEEVVSRICERVKKLCP